MSYRIERTELPPRKAIARAIVEQLDSFGEGVRLVDDDARGPSGVDVVLADGEGRAFLLDVVVGQEREVPVRAADHRAWLASTGRLFMKAYGRDGVVGSDDPIVAFICGELAQSVVEAVSAMADENVRLYVAEAFRVDGEDAISLRDVTPRVVPRVASAPSEMDVPEREAGGDGEPAPGGIRSESVRGLFELFRSGVDGLDGRIEASEEDDSMEFTLMKRPLAHVDWSPDSFTVTVGKGRSNPIVVSDRVSLERALNAVVSYFVREEEPSAPGLSEDVSEEERAELAAVWGGASSPD